MVNVCLLGIAQLVSSCDIVVYQDIFQTRHLEVNTRSHMYKKIQQYDHASMLVCDMRWPFLNPDLPIKSSHFLYNLSVAVTMGSKYIKC